MRRVSCGLPLPVLCLSVAFAFTFALALGVPCRASSRLAQRTAHLAHRRHHRPPRGATLTAQWASGTHARARERVEIQSTQPASQHTSQGQQHRTTKKRKLAAKMLLLLPDLLLVLLVVHFPAALAANYPCNEWPSITGAHIATVTKIDCKESLAGGLFTGTQIPTEIGLLTGLTHLELWGSPKAPGGNATLTGRVPAEISNLRALGVLKLMYLKELDLTLPSLAALQALTTLEMSGNHQPVALASAVPLEPGVLGNITTFKSSFSSYAPGTLSALARLTGLTYLEVGVQTDVPRLGGPLPSELGDLTNLKTLDIRVYSDVTWQELPASLARLTALEVLQFQAVERNEMPGFRVDVSWAGKLTNLRHVEVYSGHLRGSAPDLSKLGSLSYLTIKRLDLGSPTSARHEFNGTLYMPQGAALRNIQFTGLDLDCNATFHSFDAVGALALTTLRLYDACERGSRIESPAALEKLRGLTNLEKFSAFGLFTNFHDSVQILSASTKLTDVEIGDRVEPMAVGPPLTGNPWENLTDLGSVTLFGIGGEDDTAPFPSELLAGSSRPGLLWIENAWFSGPLPDVDLSKTSVQIVNTTFSSIPPTWVIDSAAQAVDVNIYLRGNANITEIPASLFTPDSDRAASIQLYMSQCGIRTLPTTIGYAKSLRWLDLSDNALTTLPLELGTLSQLDALLLSGNPLYCGNTWCGTASWFGNWAGADRSFLLDWSETTCSPESGFLGGALLGSLRWDPSSPCWIPLDMHVVPETFSTALLTLSHDPAQEPLTTDYDTLFEVEAQRLAGGSPSTSADSNTLTWLVGPAQTNTTVSVTLDRLEAWTEYSIRARKFFFSVKQIMDELFRSPVQYPRSPQDVIWIGDANVPCPTLGARHTIDSLLDWILSLDLVSETDLTHFFLCIFGDQQINSLQAADIRNAPGLGRGVRFLGPWSAELKLRTLPDKPRSPPTNVRFVSVSASSVTLAWSPPAVLTADISDLSYEAQLTATDGNATRTAVSSNGTLAARFGSLQPQTSYTVRIRAVSNLGAGPWADATFTTIEACPPGTYASGDVDSGVCSACPTGMYSDEPGLGACKLCPSDRKNSIRTGATSQAECVPDAGFFVGENVRVVPCPKGADCSRVGDRTLEQLRVLPGYWRASYSSPFVVKCRQGAYCRGSVTPLANRRALESMWPSNNISSSLCRVGHLGPLCASCDAGMKIRNTTLGCEVCDAEATSSDVAKAVGAFAALLLVYAVVSVVFAYFYIRQDTEGSQGLLAPASPAGASLPFSSPTRRGLVDTDGAQESKQHGGAAGKAGAPTRQLSRAQRATHVARFTMERVELVLGMLQVARGFVRTFDSFDGRGSLPPLLRDFIEALAVLATLDVSDVLVFGCASPLSEHYSRLVVSMVFPIVLELCLFAIFVAGVFALRRWRPVGISYDAARVRLSVAVAYAALLTLFLVYPGTSATVMQTFPCVTFSDGSRALNADLSVNCDSSEHGTWMILAIVGVVVYPVGIPVYLGIQLFRNRAAIRTREDDAGETATRNMPLSAARLQFLWGPYSPKWYVFEVIALVVRFLQVSLVQFLWPTTPLQPAAALVLCLGAITLMASARPFNSAGLNVLSVVVQSSLSVVALGGVVAYFDFSEFAAPVDVSGEVFLVAVLCAPLLVCVLQILHMLCSRREEPASTLSVGRS